MRQAEIWKGEFLAGILTEFDDGSFEFKYSQEFLQDSNLESISVTLPKQESSFRSEYLFPFFFHMMPEGVNKKLLCRIHRLDENDLFGQLVISACCDPIGSVTVNEIIKDES